MSVKVLMYPMALSDQNYLKEQLTLRAIAYEYNLGKNAMGELSAVFPDETSAEEFCDAIEDSAKLYDLKIVTLPAD